MAPMAPGPGDVPGHPYGNRGNGYRMGHGGVKPMVPDIEELGVHVKRLVYLSMCTDFVEYIRVYAETAAGDVDWVQISDI